MPDLIVYVHVPFCSSKCHFCYWTSPIPTAELVNKKTHSADYGTAVVRQVRDFSSRLRTKPAMRLIYFGGGTPSLMEAHDLAKILETVRELFPAGDRFHDVTIEIAPETVDLEKLRDLRAAGFNRISFGFQSMNETRVRQIARAHTAEQGVQAFHMARKAGFDNINIDLMLAFPDETDEEWDESLTKALSLSSDHLSIYVYKAVPGTVMARQIERGDAQPTPQAVATRRYLESRDRIVDAGYREYMFQLFARSEKRCFCDQSYFSHDCDHVGFGAGGHSLLNGYQMGHSPDLPSYLKEPRFDYKFPIADSSEALQHKLFEMLHTDRGIDPARFQRRLRIGLDDAQHRYPQIAAMFADLESGGALRDSDGCWFFPDSEARAAWLSAPPRLYETPAPKTEVAGMVQIVAASQ